MSNSTARDGNIDRLHPAIRDKVRKIRDQLHKEKIPFEVLEAFRTPERQANLYAKGRTKPGAKVTWVGPWRSIHQYGLAVDFVLKIDGKWSWDDQGAEAKYWTRMHELAKENGMTPIYNSKGQLIEKPHIQMIGVKSSDLHKGHYPDGGDAVWAEHLAELIDNWDGPGDPPPKPKLAPQRPPIDEDLFAGMDDGGAAAAGGGADPADDDRFQKLHAFVKRWEGGFVNHPRDNGKATNMGITMATLAAHRGTEVTVDDVRTLTRAEADAILKANYYTVCRCGEMPERVAMVVYNGAVLHGPKRSVTFLQRAINSMGLKVDGEPLEEDGILGRLTMAAVSKVDPSFTATAYMDQQDAYFRQHEDFDVFGNGWLNRLASLREFVDTLPQGAGLRPSTTMKVTDTNLDLDDILGAVIGAARSGGDRRDIARDLAGQLLRRRLADTRGDSELEILLKGLLTDRLDLAEPAPTPVAGAAGKPPLTPVNAALGEGLGRLLDGKKSVTGIVGMFLTVLLPKLGLSGDVVSFVSDNSQALLTILATFTGWGFLGKIDKAIRLVGAVR